MPATRKTDAVGAELYLRWTPLGGSEIDLAPFAMDFDPGEDGKYDSNTAASDLLETFQKIRESVAPKGKMAYREGTSGTTMRLNCRQGQQGTLVWGWESGTAGTPKYGILAEIKSFKISTGASKLTEISVEFVNQGTEWAFHPRNGDSF